MKISIKKTAGKPIKWIIDFMTLSLKVLFDITAIISSLNNENLVIFD